MQRFKIGFWWNDKSVELIAKVQNSFVQLNPLIWKAFSMINRSGQGAVVMAQLTARSLPIPEDPSSNQVIGKFYWTITVCRNKHIRANVHRLLFLTSLVGGSNQGKNSIISMSPAKEQFKASDNDQNWAMASAQTSFYLLPCFQFRLF